MLRYQTLKYFTVVAQCQSLTRAAEKLFISQSGLSVHMQNLERELGVQLLIRSNRNVRLTEAGQVLYDWAAPFFLQEREVIRSVRQTAMRDHTHITVGTVGANITYSLSDIIESFHEKYNGVQVTVRRMNIDPLTEALRTGAIDLGFQFLGQFPYESYLSECAHHVLERGKFVLAVHKNSPLAERRSVSFRDLRGVPIATLASSSATGPRELLFKRCAEAGFEPSIVAEYDYVEPLLTMINMGGGATITSDLAPLKGLENLRYIDLEDAPEINLAMVWRHDLKNPSAQLLIRHIVESVEAE